MATKHSIQIICIITMWGVLIFLFIFWPSFVLDLQISLLNRLFNINQSASPGPPDTNTVHYSLRQKKNTSPYWVLELVDFRIDSLLSEFVIDRIHGKATSLLNLLRWSWLAARRTCNGDWMRFLLISPAMGRFSRRGSMNSIFSPDRLTA